ncbi:MAG: hypothetical protein JWM33_3745 [Caulobacteraceae bacterium]|nr:hypothetical protein [Caulobacteraceae bacterium]
MTPSSSIHIAKAMEIPQRLSITRYDYAPGALERFSLPTNVLFDIGCGDGHFKQLEAKGFVWRGFDQTAWSLAQAWDVDQPFPYPDQGKAGAVFLLDVLEHCPSPGQVLVNIANAMELDGLLILTMPNPRWSGSRVYNLLTGYASSFRPEDLDENHHLFPIWPHVCERLLQYAGLKIEEYVHLGGPTRVRFNRLPLDLARRVMEFADPSSEGDSYGIVARKT